MNADWWSLSAVPDLWGVRMRRREIITLLGAAAAEWSSRVQAQQQAIPVVGYPFLGTQSWNQPIIDAFLSGLAAR